MKGNGSGAEEYRNAPAEPLGVSYVQAVWGIHDLINETMAAAAKTHRRTRRKLNW